MSFNFIDKIRSTIKKYQMLREGDRILVGLSGGTDSVALLHALSTLKEEFVFSMHIAHLDHMFRGEESVGDRRFCEGLAKKMKLEMIYKEINVPQIAKEKGISPEEAGRQERYGFFKEAAKAKGIKKIAVAHNKDDQAETVLMRVIRGAGMLGLGGMSPVKDMQGVKIIRPLIETSRQEIEDFIKDEGLQFRQDSSNEKLIFTRNRIRRELIPYLEKNFNANIKEVLTNMAENLRVENEFMEKFSNRKLKSSSKIKNGQVLIDLKRFKAQPEAVRKRVLRAALRQIKGDLRRLTYQHWKELEQLIHVRPVNSKVDLPSGVDVVKHKNSISLSLK